MKQALKEYTDDPDKVHIDDFAPTSLLYQEYKDYYNSLEHWPGDPPMLTLPEFGAALLRVFPHIDDFDPELGRNARRLQRRYQGKKMWGYTGMKGPLSIRSRGHVGRPRLGDKHDFDAE